jgi:DNA-binding transcriptional MocR family regulator
LRKLRRTLEAQRDAMLNAIRRHFPSEIRVSRPQGGYFVWLEMPETVKALDVFGLAMERDITIMPGTVFSPQRKFGNCIRLNYGMAWTPAAEAAVATLGGIVASLSGDQSTKSTVQALAA